ncbi:hypothetical protein [Mycobacteroides abscessus]|uniref:hypothetical protein n=1 Tax=Mycobacteroides abscessus TaxID=36809 RepID=UPI00092B7D7B|nr:hypothetical protein [Mycobacteroides abscessus]SIK54471.1 Uncharacterised protein [Mycobacteroides abscessus subsp. abscessus]SKR40567.1 Uncharacterised protein [Mycobacteroides abscessus subsp. abscessus]SKR55503.1 Uncharacterised protein [Mycobacteroides abscessus subsp. abscessus]SKS92874.1 Uncharacterised protein [Mycobacteroides abscessus subsp. abscessus]
MRDTYIALTQGEWDYYTNQHQKQRQADRQSARLLVEAITAADPTVSDRDVKTAVKVLDAIKRVDSVIVGAMAKAQGLTDIHEQRHQHELVSHGIRVTVAPDDRLWSLERLWHVQQLARQLYHELWNPARPETVRPPGEDA